MVKKLPPIGPRFCQQCGNTIPLRPWEKTRERERTRFCSVQCAAKARSLTPEQVFRKHVRPDPVTGCWLWTAYRDPKGYGRAASTGREVLAHRVAWTLYRGPIPAGQHVLHKCDNPPCCNPDHLFVGTNLDNVADRIAKGRSCANHGTANGRARLCAEDVRAIRADSRSDEVLAKVYGVRPGTIWFARTRQTWRHIP